MIKNLFDMMLYLSSYAEMLQRLDTRAKAVMTMKALYAIYFSSYRSNHA